MIIKICGVTTIDVAKTVDRYGADWIGFVFADSSRQITSEKAKEIANQLSPRIKKVGVFVNEAVDTMEKIAQMVGLDYIQLHGDEPASVAEQLTYPVIRAFSIDKLMNGENMTYPCDYFLIDSPGEKYRGGSGKTFNWHLLEQFNIDRKKIILAGGLHAENVSDAIQTVRPNGVDVSSGVETDGKKDIAKIKQFIQNVRDM